MRFISFLSVCRVRPIYADGSDGRHRAALKGRASMIGILARDER
jgi:hypothetical protein